jgi:hypothetical protein
MKEVLKLKCRFVNFFKKTSKFFSLRILNIYKVWTEIFKWIIQTTKKIKFHLFVQRIW